MMVSRGMFLILSILIIGHQVSSLTYSTDEFIEDVSFIPGARFTLTTAYKAWWIYNEVRSMYYVNGTEINSQLEEISSKLDIVDSVIREVSGNLNHLSNDVHELKSTITDKIEIDLPSQNLLYDQLDHFDEEILLVNRLFETMQEFNETEHTLAPSTYDYFIDSVLGGSRGQLSSTLEAIHHALTGGNKMLDILTKKHLTNSLVCRDGVSPLYMISDLYRNAMKAYMKGMLMNQFAYAYLKQKQSNPDSFKGELELLIRRFYIKTFEIVEKMKSVMSHASAAYWKCDAIDLHENVTYAKLSPIFQKYLLKEQDIPDDPIKCLSTCEKRKDLVIKDNCNSNFCKQQTKCSGALVGCEKASFNMNICLADPSSGRRYHYIEGKDREDKIYQLFGKKQSCRKFITANHKDWKLFECEYCKCTCLNSETNTDVDRYFSLKKVLSDVDNNKVVTGVRFVKKNYIFHIQIEEGSLLKNGVIEKNSTKWKPVHDFNISDENIYYRYDYHIIDWRRRTVHLDDLKSNGDKVLTGLRFKLVDNALQLEVRVTPFDFDTGKLDIMNSEWISNKNDEERTELDLSERDLPRANTYRHLDSEHNQFLKFTTSSFKDDVGQTVVPFIDLGEVTTPLRTPLSGAGLIHQANTDQSAGFLSFKLFNYNYAHHVGNE